MLAYDKMFMYFVCLFFYINEINALQTQARAYSDLTSTSLKVTETHQIEKKNYS